MHHIQCNWYTSVWDACGLCYFAQVLPAVLLYCCGLAFLGLVAWSQFCGYRSAARLMRSRITRIRLLFSKQFDSETSFRSNLRSSWLLGGPNWTLYYMVSSWNNRFCSHSEKKDRYFFSSSFSVVDVNLFLTKLLSYLLKKCQYYKYLDFISELCNHEQDMAGRYPLWLQYAHSHHCKSRVGKNTLRQSARKRVAWSSRL